ncbi:hypothetical protein OH146_01595 [Salinibacterium sp. SYSU T00001]|uniref:hypothetical protein n=1 Tax=Homoserinimonas sedimenticola TaxID=2986805 RepID=UPI002235B7F0|nr:hypothetical protein [Salinibacterium sedimenticola]MCW4384463.1 hypothetical protein [Salinibacterium sedimenticola]
MEAASVRIRLRDAQTRLDSAELQLGGSSPHEWKHAGEIAVSAGIAASDAICGHVLGYKVSSDAHRDALDALRSASNASTAKHLDALLAEKSAQSYGDRLPTHAEASRLVLHARRLVDAAVTVVAS